MIRILVLVLLAANLLYLGWSRWVSDEKPRLVAPETGAARPTAGTAQAPLPAASASACTTIGPVRDDTRALEIEQLLVDQQLAPARRIVTEQVREGWWVHVANPDAAAQGRSMRAIEGAGIRDAFSMPDDPQFRVSVGLFTDEARANARAEAVRALRLDAVVIERMREQPSVWFDLATAPGAVDLDRFRAEGIDVQDLRIEDCPAGPTTGDATGLGTAPAAAVAAAGPGAPGV
jgi:hypothetical protein